MEDQHFVCKGCMGVGGKSGVCAIRQIVIYKDVRSQAASASTESTKKQWHKKQIAKIPPKTNDGLAKSVIKQNTWNSESRKL